MNWNDGFEDGVKLALAAVVGGLWQRLSLSAKINKIEQIERQVSSLELKADKSATKEDLHNAVLALNSSVEAKFSGINQAIQQLNSLVVEALRNKHD